jgi:hypothetical protein
MKRIFVTAILMFACFLIVMFSPNAEAVNPLYESGSSGFQVVAAPTLTIATSSATIIGTMPPKCSSIEVIAVSADINYGASDVSTNTYHPYIPIGTSKVITTNNGSRNPTIYLRIRGTATESSTIGIAAH